MSPVPFYVDNDVALALERRLVNGTDLVLKLGRNPLFLIDTWIILYTIAQFLLILLLGTMLFAKRQEKRRRPTLINMFLCGLFSTITPCILYYAGDALNPNPPTGLCLVQATLKHGTGPMFLVSLLTVVIDITLSTREAIRLRMRRNRLREVILLVAPYITFLLWSIPVAIMGVLNPRHVERVEHLFYCSLANNVYGDISTGFGIVVILVTMGLEIWAIRMLRRSWKSVRELRTNNDIDFSLLIRVGIFSLLEIFFVIVTLLGFFLISPDTNDAVDTIFEALVYIALFVIFGLRPDIIRIWMFWHTDEDDAKSTQFTSVSSLNIIIPAPQPLAPPKSPFQEYHYVKRSSLTVSRPV